MKALILTLIIALLLPSANATSFDDIMAQLDEAGEVDTVIDEWYLYDPDYMEDTVEPDDLPEAYPDNVELVTDNEPAAADVAADVVSADEQQLADTADEPTLLAVLSGIIFFMGITTGVIFIKMLFDRVRAV